MTHTRRERDAIIRNARPLKQLRLNASRFEEKKEIKKKWREEYYTCPVCGQEYELNHCPECDEIIPPFNVTESSEPW